MSESQASFSLTELQQRNANLWIENRNKEDCGPIGGRWSYRFTPTAVGNCVVLIDNVSGDELDLTDYDSF